MLERIGGECAGAVTFVPTGEALSERNYNYCKLSTEELVAILKELPRRPLMAGEKGVRFSLAGAQDKVAARIDGDDVSLPLYLARHFNELVPDSQRLQFRRESA